MNRCKYCQNVVDLRRHKFCSQCGAPLPWRSPFSNFVLQALKCAGYFAFYYVVQSIILWIYSFYAMSQVVSGASHFQTNEEYMERFWDVFSKASSPVLIFADAVVVVLICVFLRLMKLDYKEEANIHTMPLFSFFGSLSFGFALQIFVTLTLGLIVALFPSSEPFINSQNDLVNLFKNTPFILEFLFVAVVTPIFEEFLFRGIIYTRLKKALPTSGAVILSSVIFGVAHGALVQGIYAGILGIFLALLFEKYQSIWASVAIHAAFNGGSYLLASIQSDSDSLFISLWLISLGVIFVCIAMFFFSKPIYENKPRKVIL